MLTQNELKEILDYDPLTGIFTWRITKPPQAITGEKAGRVDSKGYISINFNGESFLAHRLAWLFIHGEFPADHTDHINHDRADNRIVNLRSVTCRENQQNAKIRMDNTSGHLGVCWHKKTSKWQSTIRVNGERIHLGIFDNINDAVEARAVANKKYGFHPNHGDDQ